MLFERSTTQSVRQPSVSHLCGICARGTADSTDRGSGRHSRAPDTRTAWRQCARACDGRGCPAAWTPCRSRAPRTCITSRLNTNKQTNTVWDECEYVATHCTISVHASNWWWQQALYICDKLTMCDIILYTCTCTWAVLYMSTEIWKKGPSPSGNF